MNATQTRIISLLSICRWNFISTYIPVWGRKREAKVNFGGIKRRCELFYEDCGIAGPQMT